MFLLVPGSWARFLAGSPLDHFTGIFLIGIDWSLTFSTYPALNFNAMVNGLSQAWTLGAELVFYIFAPWLMRSWKIGAALLALSFGARAAFVIANGPGIGESPSGPILSLLQRSASSCWAISCVWPRNAGPSSRVRHWASSC
jgi:peptidoglycan/LPS O-acetylase OafA/YrhL